MGVHPTPDAPERCHRIVLRSTRFGRHVYRVFMHGFVRIRVKPRPFIKNGNSARVRAWLTRPRMDGRMGACLYRMT